MVQKRKGQGSRVQRWANILQERHPLRENQKRKDVTENPLKEETRNNQKQETYLLWKKRIVLLMTHMSIADAHTSFGSVFTFTFRI